MICVDLFVSKHGKHFWFFTYSAKEFVGQLDALTLILTTAGAVHLECEMGSNRSIDHV